MAAMSPLEIAQMAGFDTVCSYFANLFKDRKINELMGFASTLSAQEQSKCATSVLNLYNIFLIRNNDVAEMIELMIEMGGRPKQKLLDFLGAHKDREKIQEKIIRDDIRGMKDALFHFHEDDIAEMEKQLYQKIAYIKRLDYVISLVQSSIKTKFTFKSRRKSQKKSVKKRKKKL